MQWAFFVLGLLAALAELHTGTFYLAAVSAAAIVTTIVGFWIRDDWLIFVFLLLCGLSIAAVAAYRRTRPARSALADFDIGQSVTISGISPHDQHLIVSYRGTNWDAVMQDGSVPGPGTVAIITSKTDKLLHLSLPSEPAKG